MQAWFIFSIFFFFSTGEATLEGVSEPTWGHVELKTDCTLATAARIGSSSAAKSLAMVGVEMRGCKALLHLSSSKWRAGGRQRRK